MFNKKNSQRMYLHKYVSIPLYYGSKFQDKINNYKIEVVNYLNIYSVIYYYKISGLIQTP